jgi:hypothetical protein
MPVEGSSSSSSSAAPRPPGLACVRRPVLRRHCRCARRAVNDAAPACVNQNAQFTSLEGHIKYAVPRLYGAGSARSGFATCLPVPWGGWGPLVRAKKAVFRVLNFQEIGFLTCLATAVESARVIRTGSYLAHLSFDTCCTRSIRVC